MNEAEVTRLVQITMQKIGISAQFNGDRVDAFRAGVESGIRHVLMAELAAKKADDKKQEPSK